MGDAPPTTTSSASDEAAPLRAEIRRLLIEGAFLEGVDELDDDSDLFDAGLNSLTAVRMALSLEDHYDMVFADEALTRETLGSIAAISALIESERSEP